MRIALVGAPGSGKTKVAKELEKSTGLPVIDNYVEHLEGQTGISLSYNAALVPNLGIVYERLHREWEIERDVEGYIVCGTILESAAYAAMWAVDAMKVTDDPINLRQHVNAIMDVLGIITLENWDYDVVLYLPKPQSEGLDERLDFSIRESFAMLHIDHVTLSEEDPAEQAVRIVKEHLERNREETDVEPTETDE